MARQTLELLDTIRTAFPRLSIVKILGEGGQKFVFHAKSQKYGEVALKIIKTHEREERILREVEAVSRFSPPHFPKLYCYGKKKIKGRNFIFLVEELIVGESLRKRLERGPIQQEESVRIGLELLRALCDVADQNLVHRDVKPENILLGPEGRVVLLDFGIARHLDLDSLTQDYAVFGPMSLGYAAPEQIRNEKRSISVRTDLFMWGVVMYEMLSGKNPFTEGCKTPQEILVRTIQYDPPLLDCCDSVISEIVRACIQKSAHRRPSHPKVLINKLLEVI